MIQQGIILRSFLPQDIRVIIFDRMHGRFSARLRKEERCGVIQGSLVHYSVREFKQYCVVDTLEAISLPAASLCIDLQFLHHVLEVLRMFLLDRIVCRGVFEHCLLLYREEMNLFLESTQFKHLFLMKLFALLGIFPEEKIFHRLRHINALIAGSFESMLLQESTVSLDDVRAWLLGCIYTHHHVSIFTTLTIY